MARGGERVNQRSRTRADILTAAARLSRGGSTPNLEAIADEARVSRATVYRYFPSVDAVMTEAALHIVFPTVGDALGDDADGDIVERLGRVDAAVDAMIAANEGPLRQLIATAARQPLDQEEVPARQNRRLPLIDAALAPGRGEIAPDQLWHLRAALSLVIGTEAMLVLKDVLRLDRAEATKVRRWAIRALVDAARGNAA